MITAKEARELDGELKKSTISHFYDDIKSRARKGCKSATIKFFEGSEFDTFHKQIINELEGNGFECQYNIDKWMWIDLGFRSIDVRW